MKKYLAEFIGTAVLVIMGCGTAMMVGCNADYGTGYLMTALAFGLAVVVMAYAVGHISGGHFNPAVSLAMLLCGDISGQEFLGYIASQVLGGLAGAGVLALVFNLADKSDLTGAYGANSIAALNDNAFAGLVIEIVLTFIFVLTVLGVTSKKSKSENNAGLVIGLALTLVHLVGIGLTGTSVNPARSIGPAIFAAFAGATYPLSCLWVFIVAPMAGGWLAYLAHKALEKKD